MLTEGARLLSLFGFNVGVEIGQLAIVAFFFPLVFKLRHWRFYPPVVVQLGSLMILTLASLWFTERAFNLSLLPG